jgi:hypothetical protein
MASKNVIGQSQPTIQPNFGLDITTQFSEEQEWKNADQAVLDFRATGQSLKRCLRCGGKFQFVEGGSGFRIRCEKEGCFEEIVRGI